MCNRLLTNCPQFRNSDVANCVLAVPLEKNKINEVFNWVFHKLDEIGNNVNIGIRDFPT